MENPFTYVDLNYLQLSTFLKYRQHKLINLGLLKERNIYGYNKKVQ